MLWPVLSHWVADPAAHSRAGVALAHTHYRRGAGAGAASRKGLWAAAADVGEDGADVWADDAQAGPVLQWSVSWSPGQGQAWGCRVESTWA